MRASVGETGPTFPAPASACTSPTIAGLLVYIAPSTCPMRIEYTIGNDPLQSPTS